LAPRRVVHLASAKAEKMAGRKGLPKAVLTVQTTAAHSGRMMALSKAVLMVMQKAAR